MRYYLLIFFILSKSAYCSYIVNLTWFNRVKNIEQTLVFPETYDRKNLLKVLQKWSETEADAVWLWYDSETVTDKQIHATEALFLETSPKLKLISMDRIPLWRVPVPAPTFFKLDLARLQLTTKILKSKKPEYNYDHIVYADFDIKVMSEVELFDENTQKILDSIGVVFADGGVHAGLENGFHIVSATDKKIAQAIYKAMTDTIRINQIRAKAAADGELLGFEGKIDLRSIAQIVYDSYSMMIRMIYHQLGVSKITYGWPEEIKKKEYSPGMAYDLLGAYEVSGRRIVRHPLWAESTRIFHGAPVRAFAEELGVELNQYQMPTKKVEHPGAKKVGYY